MSNQGKQVISKLAAKLAPTQENKLVVNGYTDNAPIGPALQRQGVTSNQILSQKRADDSDAISDLARRKAGSRVGARLRRRRPRRFE